MPYIAYLPNSRVTLLDLDEVAEVARTGQYIARGQSLGLPIRRVPARRSDRSPQN